MDVSRASRWANLYRRTCSRLDGIRVIGHGGPRLANLFGEEICGSALRSRSKGHVRSRRDALKTRSPRRGDVGSTPMLTTRAWYDARKTRCVKPFGGNVRMRMRVRGENDSPSKWSPSDLRGCKIAAKETRGVRQVACFDGAPNERAAAPICRRFAQRNSHSVNPRSLTIPQQTKVPAALCQMTTRARRRSTEGGTLREDTE